MAKTLSRICAVPHSAVVIDDPFWSPRLKTNRNKTLLHEFNMLKKFGHIDALKLEWKKGDPNPPHIFWESDTAKWIEACAYSLATHPDAELEAKVDEVIALLAGAQQKDGYLNAHFTVVEPDKRFTNLRDLHELYCAGHLIEAGVAHYHATGKRTLLDVMCKFADYIDSVFGPGKRTGYCGHEEIELALVKLYRATGEKRYLNLSKYFIDERGKSPIFFEEEAKSRGETVKPSYVSDMSYYQAHVPVRKQKEAVGHAVRAMYLYCGMADVAAETSDSSLLSACMTLWENVTERKMYLTGGIGSRHVGETFGDNYELPNLSAYAETCAAIGLVLFAHRMTQLDPDGRYMDVAERALYNGVISGVSVDGQKYFYVNPLASVGLHHRQEWYGCACCPPNLARLLASLGGYIYATGGNGVYVNLYISSSAKVQIGGANVTLAQKTEYPYEGNVSLKIGTDKPAKFAIHLRVPGWCRDFAVKVNGKKVKVSARKGYVSINQKWNNGDVIELSLALNVERVVSDPHVTDNVGCVALQRGPLVYCFEQCDHKIDLATLAIPEQAKIVAKYEPKTLGGTVVLSGVAAGVQSDALYTPVSDVEKPKAVPFKAIPYYLWDNRKAGAMKVWLPKKV